MSRSHDSSPEFGELLRHTRHTAGMTQEELAEKAGLSTRGISDLERGARHTPQRMTLALLADALDLTDAERSSWERVRQAAAHKPAPAVALSPRFPPSTARLPHPPSSLIGRRRETQDVATLLRDAQVRLVTLTGPGGVGKTRLAIAVAKHVQDSFRDGVVYIPLQSLTNLSLLPATIARALKVRELGNEPLIERLMEVVGDKQLLLVLDNFEQLLPAASVVSDLLVACPELTILVTSRSVLHLSGEYDYFVPPLAVPDSTQELQPEQAQVHDAVALFSVRAQAASATFSLTSENARTVSAICARLDGLPLAIELAAARTRLLSPRELLSRLDQSLAVLTGGPRDTPERHQTMRATIAWTYELLDPPVQALFRRLAVFNGGWSLDYADVIGGGLVSPGTLDGLTTLAEFQLTQQREAEDGSRRFVMLEVIRQYGQEELARVGEELEARERHLRYVLAAIEQAGSAESSDSGDGHWLEALAPEYDNLVAAFNWAIETRNVPEALRLIEVLEKFWFTWSNVNEARQPYEALLALPELALDPGSHCRVLHSASTFRRYLGDEERAVSYSEQSLTIARETGDQQIVAESLRSLAMMAFGRNDHERARALFQESLCFCRALGYTSGIIEALTFLGMDHYTTGELDTAEQMLREALGLAITHEQPMQAAVAYQGLAPIATQRGHLADAVDMLRKTAEVFLDLGPRGGLVYTLENLASVWIAAGDAKQAAVLAGTAGALRQQTGIVLSGSALVIHLATLKKIRAVLDEVVWQEAWNAGQSLSPEEALELGFEREPVAEPVASITTVCGDLTPREIEVLQLLAEGRSNQEIADALFISPHTAISHIAHIMNKLGVESRTAAASWAIRQGIA